MGRSTLRNCWNICERAINAYKKLDVSVQISSGEINEFLKQ